MKKKLSIKTKYLIIVLSILLIFLTLEIIFKSTKIFPVLYSVNFVETYLLFAILTLSATTVVFEISFKGPDFILTNYLLPSIVGIYLIMSEMVIMNNFLVAIISILISVFALIVLTRFVVSKYVFAKLRLKGYFDFVLMAWYLIPLTIMMIVSFNLLY
jgi:hypothetical protein